MPTNRRVYRLLPLLLIAAALPGCQLWNAWLDALKWRDNPGGGGPGTPMRTADAAPAAIPPGGGLGNTPSMIPRVTVYSLTMPLGAFSGNDQVWSQLNEDAIDSKTAMLMAQNGLRAATGAISRWPVIAKMIDAPGSNSDKRFYQTDGHTAINVLTRPGVTEQTVVSVDRDLQQQGRTFESCDNSFRLLMRGVRGKPELMVQLEPIVTLGTIAVIRTGAEMGVTRSGFTSEESFADLQMTTTLTADQFLVVSAMDPRTSSFSVGSLWLSDKDRAPATETILIFVPSPVTPPKAAAK